MVEVVFRVAFLHLIMEESLALSWLERVKCLQERLDPSIQASKGVAS